MSAVRTTDTQSDAERFRAALVALAVSIDPRVLTTTDQAKRGEHFKLMMEPQT